MRISALPPKSEREDDGQAIILRIENEPTGLIVEIIDVGADRGFPDGHRGQAGGLGCGEMIGEFMDMVLDFLDLAMMAKGPAMPGCPGRRVEVCDDHQR